MHFEKLKKRMKKELSIVENRSCDQFSQWKQRGPRERESEEISLWRIDPKIEKHHSETTY
jgi:hypothetical protein